MRRAPLRKNSFTFHRCSFSCHNWEVHGTIFVYKICVGPYVARVVRVSPPELAREFPGPHESSNVTFAPLCASWSADQPPNAPAPTTITESGRDPVREGEVAM